MSYLPPVGSSVQLFGTGCEGCGHFSGIFAVLDVQEEGVTALILDPELVQCEGGLGQRVMGPLRIIWNRDIQCWEAQCGGHPLVVKIAGHFRGPRVGEIRTAAPTH